LIPALKHYPYSQLGQANHGWLDARHHFSFARYWNPERVHFGTLRVINDDKVAAGYGFSPHSHDNMEIITYVRRGVITHQDNIGNEGKTNAGDVQVMSAGSGITHSEMNKETIDTTLYQIWIEPNQKNVKPRWDTKAFPKNALNGALPPLVSGQPEHKDSGALFIYQDAAIYGGQLEKGAIIIQTIKHNAYILASLGEFEISLSNGERITLKKGDGAEISNVHSFTLSAIQNSEIIVIDTPA